MFAPPPRAATAGSDDPGLWIVATYALCVIVSLGFALVRWSRYHAARARLGGAVRARIADVRGDALVRVEGKVVAGPEGTLIALGCGSPVVHNRFELQHSSFDDMQKRNVWTTIEERTEGKAFLLDDDSGEPAQVALGRAAIVSRSSTSSAMNPAIEEILRAKGIDPADAFKGRYRWRETVLMPGESLVLVGRIARGPLHVEIDENAPAVASTLGEAALLAPEKIALVKAAFPLAMLVALGAIVGVIVAVVAITR